MKSLEDIATKAGVSPRTVARVLRGDLRESWASTAARASEIRKIARSMGYRTNSSARAIRSGKFSCIGLLLSSLDGRSYLPEPLLDGINDALHKHGYHLTLGRLPDSELITDEAFPKLLREWCCDGLLVNYTDRIPPAMLKHLRAQVVPSVWLNCKQPHDCVYYDDEGAGHELTRRMIEAGHRRISYVDFTTISANDQVHYSRADRYAGYVRAMREAGLTPDEHERFAGAPREQQLGTLKALLTSEDRPTAVVTYEAGYQVMFASALAGLSVPRDLSVGTFTTHSQIPGQPHVDKVIGMHVASMNLPTRLAGQTAVECVLERISCPDERLDPVVLSASFQPGDTFAPPGS